MSETKRFRVGETGRVVELYRCCSDRGTPCGQWVMKNPRYVSLQSLADWEAVLGAPLVELPPEPPVWWTVSRHYSGSDVWHRVNNGAVQYSCDRGNHWVYRDAGELAYLRLIAALAEGREPDPSIAERVPPASGPEGAR